VSILFAIDICVEKHVAPPGPATVGRQRYSFSEASSGLERFNVGISKPCGRVVDSRDMFPKVSVFRSQTPHRWRSVLQPKSMSRRQPAYLKAALIATVHGLPSLGADNTHPLSLPLVRSP
jgi:hypothetical protein